ncbi:branched-chain amino acid transporter permease [Paratissierella segnis]|nr:branched-chain amino acid transporter permease [Paratissierella segnis]
MSNTHAAILIAVMALVTMILRFLPFMIFRDRETPEYINFLGKYLPYSIMGMLVVYCLKDVSITSSPFGIPELISVVLVAVLHFWKRNTLVSIVSGTVCYMLLIQVF